MLALVAALLEMQLEAATVAQAGEFVGAGEFLGLAEAMARRAQVVERALQVEVAAAQAGDQAVFVEHHAHDRAAQEMREQPRVALRQRFEFVLGQLEQADVGGGGRIGAARVVADQQAELAEEFMRAQALGRRGRRRSRGRSRPA